MTQFTSNMTQTEKNNVTNERVKHKNIKLAADYLGAKTKTTWRCLDCEHEWVSYPSTVFGAKKGCPACWANRRGKSMRLTQSDFIKKAEQIHDNKYSYTKTEYKTAHTKVIITCPTHGDFVQRPGSHLDGCGCPICGNELVSTKHKKSTTQFIQDARTVHGTMYNYTKVNYINAKTPIIVTCNTHGDFIQIPSNHLSGMGCPTCSSSKGERKIQQILKERGVTFVSQHKFNDCVNPLTQRSLPFDFFIPSKNLLIEYDGEHHFVPTQFYGSSIEKAMEEHELTKYRDNIKNEYAASNKLTLIRIPYTDFNIIENLLLAEL